MKKTPDSAAAPDADVLNLAAAADAAAAGSQTGDTQSASGDKGPEPAADGPQEIPTREMLATLLRPLIEKASKRFPSLAGVWTPGDVDVFCMGLAPLLDKYGFTPSWLKAWQVEIAALMMCGPLVFATVIAVRADLEAERARAAKPAGDGQTERAAAAGAPAGDGKVRPKSTGE